MASETVPPEGIFSLESNNDTVIIAFSGFQNRLGMSEHPYYFLKNIHKKGFDILFLKDEKKAWYHSGVKADSNSIDDLAQDLKQLVSRYQHSVTFGSSMGGYGAILMASLIKADICVSVVPQTFIDVENRKKFGDLRNHAFKDRVCLSSSHPEFLDLKAYLSNQKESSQLGKTIYLIFYGDKIGLDIIHAMRMAELPHFHVFRVKGADHSASEFLRNSHTYDRLFSKIRGFNEDEFSESALVDLLNKEQILM